MATRNYAMNIWRPSSEAVETVGKVLGAHWRATHGVGKVPYWPKPASWLNRQASRLFTARVPYSSY